MLVAALTDISHLAPSGGLVLAVGLLAVLLGVVLAQIRFRRPIPLYAMAPRRKGRKSGKTLLFGSVMNRRESLRRRGQRVRVQLADAKGEKDLGTAWVVDRSTGGLGLLCPNELEVGRVICVRPVHATSRMPWVEVEVKCCRAEGSEWEVGCRFLRRPSLNMLVLFG